MLQERDLDLKYEMSLGLPAAPTTGKPFIGSLYINIKTFFSDVKSGRRRHVFSATMSRDIANVQNHATIVFDNIITNIGAAYSPSNGVFTCKMAGIYVFVWTTTNKNRTWMNTELVLNGQRKGIAFSDSGDHDDHSVASNTVVLDLDVGDQVWIRAGTWHNGHLGGESCTSFSGFML